MAITFREIADTVDSFDDEAEELNNTRKEFWAEIREQVSPHDVKALKEAIRIRRKRRKDPSATEAHDQRVSDILSEISVDKSAQEEHARAPVSRASIVECAPPHDPITGELLSNAPPDPALDGEAQVSSSPGASPLISDHDGFPDLPSFLDRRSAA